MAHMNVVDPRLMRPSERATDAAEARERAYESSLAEDLAAEWVLPIGMRPDQSLRSDRIEGQASMEVPIPAVNRGYQMLIKMGWAGGGLGPRRNGIVEPVRGGTDRWDRAGGVGRQQQDEFYTDEDNIERKKMLIEVEETTEEKAKREQLHLKETKIKEVVSDMVSVFKCELCNKQYKVVMEYEQHLSSYDHHHKKRLIEMKEKLKEPKGDVQKREQRRADKEMAKFTQMFEAQSQGAQSAVGLTSHPSTGAAVEASGSSATELPSQDGRQAVKLGFGAGKKQKGGMLGKKPKMKPGLSAFKFDDDEET